MGDVAVRVENLGKKYRLGGPSARYHTLRDQVVKWVRNPLGMLRGGGRAEEFWALKDVSFEVRRGEVVGIIGRNGAGKSTLLKILSQITEPTAGEADIYGRVGSLLEVGTGFNPELTGRENVFLNGAILGMRRTEIVRRFDEIVAFAEVEKFIDTPAKHYSSGMYMRLAFAVAAHLEPEILIVDEVLAVGDAAFQKKCLGKMSEVAQVGRTVIFVSHNMAAVAELCTTAYLLDSGKVRSGGPACDVIQDYLKCCITASPSWLRPAEARTTRAQLMSARVVSKTGETSQSVGFDESFAFEIEYHIKQPVLGCTIAFKLIDQQGIVVLVSSERDSTDWEGKTRLVGKYTGRCHVPGSLLRCGNYSLTIGTYREGSEIIERFENLLSFEVTQMGCPATDGRQGIISPVLQWQSVYEGQQTASL